MKDFQNYVEFKEANPYSEKDLDFEKPHTPLAISKDNALRSHQTRASRII